MRYFVVCFPHDQDLNVLKRLLQDFRQDFSEKPHASLDIKIDVPYRAAEGGKGHPLNVEINCDPQYVDDLIAGFAEESWGYMEIYF